MLRRRLDDRTRRALAQQCRLRSKAVDKVKKASPIKHVIINLGENRSFDHIFEAPMFGDEGNASGLEGMGSRYRHDVWFYTGRGRTGALTVEMDCLL